MYVMSVCYVFCSLSFNYLDVVIAFFVAFSRGFDYGPRGGGCLAWFGFG